MPETAGRPDCRLLKMQSLSMWHDHLLRKPRVTRPKALPVKFSSNLHYAARFRNTTFKRMRPAHAHEPGKPLSTRINSLLLTLSVKLVNLNS